MSAKFIEPSHHLADPDAAARKLVEIANGTAPSDEGPILGGFGTQNGVTAPAAGGPPAVNKVRERTGADIQRMKGLRRPQSPADGRVSVFCETRF